MNKDYVNFCFTADKNYIKIIAITMSSILMNLSVDKIARFFVFTQGCSDSDIKELDKLKEIAPCEIINVSMEDYLHFFDCIDTSQFKNKWISIACYFRLLMMKILPEDVKKCFYIDGDMIVDCDLAPLFDEMKEEELAHVVCEPNAMQYREGLLSHCYEMNAFRNFKSSPLKFPYFNAGFFLLNVEMSKKLNLFEKSFEFLANYPNPPYADQDTLNVVLCQMNADKLRFLAPEYNVFCNINYEDTFNRLIYSEFEVKSSFANPKIFHYAGEMKPWSHNNVMNHNKVWWDYYKKSPWGSNAFLLKVKIYLRELTMKNVMGQIFSIKNVDKYKVFTIWGIKIKFKRKLKVRESCMEEYAAKFETFVSNQNITNFENFLDSCSQKITCNYAEFIASMFNAKSITVPAWNDEWLVHLRNLKYLFSNSEINFLKEIEDIHSEKYFFWGTRVFDAQMNVLDNAKRYGRNGIVTEVGFLTCIDNVLGVKSRVPEYYGFVSFMFDDLAPYYDARRKNRLEEMLNDKNLVITDEQKLRARKCINKILETNLTKYNHQPIFEPKIGREGVKKVLVVDQSYGDTSISKGLANDKTFASMLESAILENPDADIIVKTHPDTRAGARGYYTGMARQGNVYPMTDPINPLSLIKYCDKVYVCTTQLGFEALMCGKEVNVFGMPFYAGLGLTQDRQKCERRTNLRSLEEVFYISYILYTYYVNPDKKCRCEIEEAMDYLLEKRDSYFQEVL